MTKQLTLFLLLVCPIWSFAQIQTTHLTTEYRPNPLGLDVQTPHLAWRIVADKRNVKQTAFRILVASTPVNRKSSQSSINLPPSVFQWEKHYYWKVKVWTNKGASDWSEIAHFSTGVKHWSAPDSPFTINHSPLQWIGFDSLMQGDRPFDTFPTMPARYLRKEFSTAKKIIRATAYIAAGGLYELYFNGQKIGDAVLAPAATDYSKRVFYNTFDVTPSVKTGKNCVGILLGNGRFCSPRPHRISAPPAAHFGLPKVLFHLTIDYNDGTQKIIISDTTWRISNKGAIVSNNEFDGEFYDARKELINKKTPLVQLSDTLKVSDNYAQSTPSVFFANYWSSTGYKENETWQSVQKVSPAAPILQSQINPPIRIIETIKPKNLTQINNTTWVFDIGQNMVGWAKIKVIGKFGSEISLRYSENINSNGTLNLDNIRSAKVTDTYILRGGLMSRYGCILPADTSENDPKNTPLQYYIFPIAKSYKSVIRDSSLFQPMEEEWEPRFVYHGFRYIEFTSLHIKPTLETLEGRVVHDDVGQIGYFETSDTLLNQLFSNAKWGIRGNYHGFPTDCPQRDERQGWLGDRTIVGTSESFIFNNHLLYKKWFQDIADAQNTEGSIPDVAPKFWKVYSDNMTWPAALPFNMEMLYNQFGDAQTIENHYVVVKKWLGYMRLKYADTEGVILKDQYGDWSMPPEDIREVHPKDSTRRTPAAFLATAFYIRIAQQMAHFAQILGKTSEQKAFENDTRILTQNFNRRFFHAEQMAYANNTATANVLALAFDIVPEEYRRAVFQKIVHKIEVEAQGHQTTGLIGLQQLMRLLSNEGRLDLAIKLARDTAYPSWGYMVNRGATTYWEHWNGDRLGRRNSGNHVMMIGDLIIWQFENLAGIKAAESGFKTIEMRLPFAPELGFVNANYESPFGKIVSNWQWKEGKIEWQIEIPANTEAIIDFSNFDSNNYGMFEILENKRPLSKKLFLSDRKIKIGSGKYYFTTKRFSR
jgi:alpha-L-rhamnosidase